MITLQIQLAMQLEEVFDLKRKGEETTDEEFEHVAEKVGWTPNWDVKDYKRLTFKNWYHFIFVN